MSSEQVPGAVPEGRVAVGVARLLWIAEGTLWNGSKLPVMPILGRAHPHSLSGSEGDELRRLDRRGRLVPS